MGIKKIFTHIWTEKICVCLSQLDILFLQLTKSFSCFKEYFLNSRDYEFPDSCEIFCNLILLFVEIISLQGSYNIVIFHNCLLVKLSLNYFEFLQDLLYVACSQQFCILICY